MWGKKDKIKLTIEVLSFECWQSSSRGDGSCDDDECDPRNNSNSGKFCNLTVSHEFKLSPLIDNDGLQCSAE